MISIGVKAIRHRTTTPTHLTTDVEKKGETEAENPEHQEVQEEIEMEIK